MLPIFKKWSILRNPALVSVIDQAAISAFNFVLALLLIRTWSNEPEMFGAYASVLAISLSLTSVQNALVIGQMTVLRPKAESPGEEDDLMSLFWTVNAGLMAAAAIAAALAARALLPSHGILFDVSAALFVAAALLREYTRCYHFSMLQVQVVLAVDSAAHVMSGLVIAALWLFWPPITLDGIFLVLGCANVLSSVPAILPHRRHFGFRYDASSRQRWSTIWRQQSRWALLGVTATEVQQRGYVYVVAAVFGLASVAILQAAALLYRPVQLVVHAWGKTARVVLAGLMAEKKFAEARVFTLRSLSLFGLFFAAFLAVLALAWPLIKVHVLQGSFADAETVVVLWGAASAVIMAAGILSLEAQSMIRFRELSHASLAGAAACGAGLLVAVWLEDFRATLIAVIAGQAILLVMILRILYRSPEDCILSAPKPAAPVAMPARLQERSI
jgi:O-antigen/teichoic acid export membrane protein